jgi:hypothetical protein
VAKSGVSTIGLVQITASQLAADGGGLFLVDVDNQTAEVCISAASLAAYFSGNFSGVAQITASEDIAAGAMVNIWDNAGIANIRNASAAVWTKPAHAFASGAVASGSIGQVVFTGQNTTSGLTPGTLYLSPSTPGGVTSTAPTTPGQAVQIVGIAISATTMNFAPQGMVGL